MAIVRYYKDPKTGSLIGVDEEGKGHIQKLFNIPTNGMIGGNASLPDNIIADETGLYQVKNEKVYPISHPDISTQQSILPQRFGKFDIKEVLVSIKKEEIVIISPSSYNDIPLYQQSEPTQLLQNTPQYKGDKITYRLTPYLCRIDNQFAFIISSGFAVTSSVGWFAIATPSYDLGTLTGLGPTILVYPFYDDAEAYPGCFRYFAYTNRNDSRELYYAKILAYEDNPSVINVTLEEIANDGVPLYDITLNPEIPSSATIISASSFNSEACVPAICKKEDGKWTITNNEDVEPDFTLVRYYEEESGGYYYTSPEPES